MELTQILFYGAVSGIAAGILNGLLAPAFVERDAAIAWRERKPTLELAGVALHLVAGLTLALLFWLSWGLTAIVGVVWWQRGLCFALLTWLALGAPLLVNQFLAARVPWKFTAKSAWDWLITCLAVGLACAWSWNNGR